MLKTAALNLTLLLALSGLYACGLETGPNPHKDSGVTSGSGAGKGGGAAESGSSGNDGGKGGSTSGTGGAGKGGSGAGGAGTSGGGVSGAGTGGAGTTGTETGGMSGSPDDAGSAGSTPVGCTSDDACPVDHPQCNASGECGPCTNDSACEARDGLTRCALSGADQGECVQCVEEADCAGLAETPHCVGNVCSECATHADCVDPLKPQCSGGTCVACTGDEACEGRASGEHCVTDAGASDVGQCVACTEHAHCANPTPECGADHTCTGCTGNDACTGRVGTTVCDQSSDAAFSGQCVQCTGTSYASCTQGGMHFVCDSKTRTCSTTALEHGADACQTCISDAQCQTGKMCVMQTFDDPFDAPDQGNVQVGYFCAWRLDASPGPNGDCHSERPFVKALANSQSIDGVTTDTCVLSATTCPGYADFNGTDCKSDVGTADDDLCGAPGLHDGYCIATGGSTFTCTTLCGGLNDCDPNVNSMCPTGSSPRLCTIP